MAVLDYAILLLDIFLLPQSPAPSSRQILNALSKADPDGELLRYSGIGLHGWLRIGVSRVALNKLGGAFGRRLDSESCR